MIRLIAGMFFVTLLATTPAYGKSLPVNSYSCSAVEYKIDFIRDQQRKPNRAKRADKLNSLMRDYKELRRDCKKYKYL